MVYIIITIIICAASAVFLALHLNKKDSNPYMNRWYEI